MKRLLSLSALAVMYSGCGTPEAPAGPPKEAKAPVTYFQVNPTEAARVRGVVRFAGTPAKARQISMDAEEACQKLHKTPVWEEVVLKGKTGGLANVFVYLKTGLEGKKFAPNEQAVVLEQRGCQFLPRVIGLRAGQTLSVKNSDPVSHNVHPVPVNNRDWNQQQPPEAPDLKRKFAYPEVMIPVKCNIHAWMKSYIGVLDHPYFAVTSIDGAFEFRDLPPGQYTIAAWHERLGESTHQVSVKAAETATSNFEFR